MEFFLLASTAIMMRSVIAVLMTTKNGNQSVQFFVFGDTSEFGISIKFYTILVCFLVAFLFNLQSTRYYSHASILINVPFKKMYSHQHHHHLTTEYVARSVNKGSYFWSLFLIPIVLLDFWSDSDVCVALRWFQCFTSWT